VYESATGLPLANNTEKISLWKKMIKSAVPYTKKGDCAKAIIALAEKTPKGRNGYRNIDVQSIIDEMRRQLKGRRILSVVDAELEKLKAEYARAENDDDRWTAICAGSCAEVCENMKHWAKEQGFDADKIHLGMVKTLQESNFVKNIGVEKPVQQAAERACRTCFYWHMKRDSVGDCSHDLVGVHFKKVPDQWRHALMTSGPVKLRIGSKFSCCYWKDRRDKE